MMSKASQIILLCEDKLQEVVVRRFLKEGWGVGSRKIRVVPFPNGKGSGESHVRKKYPKNLKAYRSRSAQTILIAVIDADTGSVAQHHRELDNACQGFDPRFSNEAVVHMIPKYHIETWLAYLDGQAVDEDKKYKSDYQFKGCESNCHRLVDQLVGKCKSNTPLNSPPASLSDACNEFSRIRNIL